MKYSKPLCIFLICILFLLEHPLHACSVAGYIGNESTKSTIMMLLDRLSSRGYDSTGLAFLPTNDISQIRVIKRSGKLEVLTDALQQEPLDGNIGIGHSRWATHGEPVEKNAHPHVASLPGVDGDSRSVAIVHNGIIENFSVLKAKFIEAGHTFSSDTDSEVIAHVLLESVLAKKGYLVPAVQETVKALKGKFAFLGMISGISDTLIAARKGSPLAIGLGTEGVYIASEPVFADRTGGKVIYMPEDSFAIITKDTYEIFSSKSGERISVSPKTVDISSNSYELGHYKHFMLKEIEEDRIPAAIRYCQTLGHDIWEKLGLLTEQLTKLDAVHIFGCGTSFNAARIGTSFFQRFSRIKRVVAEAHLAHEFPFGTAAGNNPFFLAISQSGETADVRNVISKLSADEAGRPIVAALTNVDESTITRDTAGRYLCLNAGPELAVASTKAFTNQVGVLYYLSHHIALTLGHSTEKEFDIAVNDLLDASKKRETSLVNNKANLEELAEKFANMERFIYLGKGIGVPLAAEGALKLFEIADKSAMAFPAGELKHGPMALLKEEGTPVILFSHQDPAIYAELLNSAQQVKARKGVLVAFAFEDQSDLIKLANDSGGRAILFPRVGPLLEPLVMAGAMQYFAYRVAANLGLNIDKPNNLAKSVTVD